MIKASILRDKNVAQWYPCMARKIWKNKKLYMSDFKKVEICILDFVSNVFLKFHEDWLSETILSLAIKITVKRIETFALQTHD